MALAALAAAPAMAAGELSVDQRLDDRREVAAGTRAQVLGFEDGRFYAQGWHITGEMGGIVTPPLKLLDSVSFGIDGQWIGKARQFTSGAGYVRYDLPRTAGIDVERTDVAPDGVRGALLGLELRNPGNGARTVRVQVDAHSELMGQYPWGFDGVVPRASDNAPDTGAYAGGRLVFRDTGQLPGEAAPHSYTAMVGSYREPVRGAVGPGHYGPNGMGRKCVATQDPTPAPMPKDCDDGPFGKGTGGRLTYELKLPAGGAKSLWIGVAGSDDSPADARSALRKLTRDPGRTLREKQRTRKQLARWTQLWLPGDPQNCRTRSSGASRTSPTSRRRRPGSTCAGRTRARSGPTSACSLARMRWIGAGYPDYPWLFGVDGEYTAHASVSLGQFEAIEDHLRALRDISDQLSARSGVVVHEVVSDGSIWFGRDGRRTNPDGTIAYDFNTDEILKFPAAVALVWRWTGTTASATRCSTSWAAGSTTWPRSSTTTTMAGRRQRQRGADRTGRGEARQRRLLHPRALRLRRHGAVRGHDGEGRRRAGEGGWPRRPLRGHVVDGGRGRVRRLAQGSGQRADQPEALDRCDPDGRRAGGRRADRPRPGARGARDGGLARARRSLLQRDSALNRGLFHTACGGGPTGDGEFNIISIDHMHQSVGEGNYGRLGADQQSATPTLTPRRMFDEPATEATPRRAAGAMPEIFPSYTPEGAVRHPANIDRCWTCRLCSCRPGATTGRPGRSSISASACRPDLGRDRLEIMPLVPGDQPLQGSNIRLGDGSVDVQASHTGDRYVTTAVQHGAGISTLLLGHTLPAGAEVARVTLDGRATDDYTTRETSRGLELRVEAGPRGRHTLVVTTVG